MPIEALHGDRNQSQRPYTIRLLAGVLLINLFVIAFACFFLKQSRTQDEQQTEATTKNLSQVLAQNISGSIDKTNLILLSATDEIEKQLTKNKIEALSLESYLSLQRERLPEINRILVTNAQGEILFGGDGPVKTRRSVADRDYFINLRDKPTHKLVIGKPIAGVVDGRWIQIFARRINNPDGSFAGVVTGSIRLEHYLKLFSSVNVGEHGAIALRDKDLAMVARHPEPQGIGSTVGQKTVSKTLQDFVDSGKSSITYKATSKVDNTERTYSCSKVSDYAMYINVGMATSDYLADWREEVIRVTVTVSIFILLTCFLSWLVFSKWKREKQAEEELRRGEVSLQAANDKLQEQYEELQRNEASLRDQNDELQSVEEMLREQIDEYEASQKLLKEREEALRNEKAFLRSLIDSADDLIYFKDCKSNYLGCNKASVVFSGLSEQEQIGKSDYDFFEKDIAEQIVKHDQKVLEGGVAVYAEEWVTSAAGSKLLLDTLKTPIFSLDGQPIGLVGISRDITDKKRTEELLRESEKNFRSIIEVSPVPLAMNDDNGNITYLNKAFVEVFGYTTNDIPTLENWWPLAYPDQHYRQVVADGWQRNLDESKRTGGAFAPMEVDIACKDGSVRTFMCSATALHENFVGNHLVVLYDITDIKKAEAEKIVFEQQLQHTQKLESLGVLSGGIAHDFNNILAIIMGYCHLTKMDYEKAETNIIEIEKAAERAAGLCRQMLAYAGKAQLTKTQVNMRMLVDEMVTMLKSTLPQNAVITSDLPSDLPFIDADASQLRQIVMNLIINASEAIGKEQGEIHASLARTTVIAGKSDKDYNGKAIPPGVYICLKVTDSGCGMDEETKWRIFEPFYTTKFTGRGLGMSAVLGIINSHGGALQLFSQLGQGTTFKVYLPAQKSDSGRDVDQLQSVPSVSWQGSGTVLLVEDEDQVRHIAKALLNNFGFTVLEAVNGREALELYKKNANDISLIVTDMGMPVMDGYELFYELKKLEPALPIVISSGYGDAEVTSRIGSDNIAGVISKPYNPDQLREVLKGVFVGAQSART